MHFKSSLILQQLSVLKSWWSLIIIISWTFRTEIISWTFRTVIPQNITILQRKVIIIEPITDYLLHKVIIYPKIWKCSCFFVNCRKPQFVWNVGGKVFAGFLRFLTFPLFIFLCVVSNSEWCYSVFLLLSVSISEWCYSGTVVGPSVSVTPLLPNFLLRPGSDLYFPKENKNWRERKKEKKMVLTWSGLEQGWHPPGRPHGLPPLKIELKLIEYK